MGALEDAAEARIAARKAANEAADAAEKAKVAAASEANAASKPLTRAQQVTAQRLATSPIAQEAARTTKALKSFTAKGGLLGVPGSNIQTSVTGATTSGPINYTDPDTGEVIVFNSQEELMSYLNTKARTNRAVTADQTATTQTAAAALAEDKQAQRKSAYDLLYAQFKQYGLEALVEPLKGLITSNTAPSEFIIKLRETDAYKKRFAGNAARVAKGLAAISEAEYIGLEDQYQNIMRNYGLPASYWSKDSMGTQAGFTNFIGNDVSATELEDRIMTAQKRVINSNPQVTDALKKFYPEITNGDILAYTLDPTQGLDVIKRKITAAEIGGAALAQGLETGVTRAEELAKYGVTKEQAMQGYQTAAEVLPRGGQLAAIYGESPYTQQTAEQEIFGLAGSTEAAKQRKKLVGLERASFSGQTGLTQGALGRERAGNL